MSAVSHVSPFTQWFCLNFRWYLHLISGEFIGSNLSMWPLQNQIETFRLSLPVEHVTHFAFPLLLSSVPGYIPNDSQLSASGPRYSLVTLSLHSNCWDPFPPCCAARLCMFNLFVAIRWYMAVVSLFTFASLTDGRTVRDLPKQRREKNRRPMTSRATLGYGAFHRHRLRNSLSVFDNLDHGADSFASLCLLFDLLNVFAIRFSFHLRRWLKGFARDLRGTPAASRKKNILQVCVKTTTFRRGFMFFSENPTLSDQDDVVTLVWRQHAVFDCIRKVWTLMKINFCPWYDIKQPLQITEHDLTINHIASEAHSIPSHRSQHFTSDDISSHASASHDIALHPVTCHCHNTKKSHHIKWHATSQLTTPPHLPSPYNQPHYFAANHMTSHTISQHRTSPPCAHTPQKHNQLPPDRTAEGFPFWQLPPVCPSLLAIYNFWWVSNMSEFHDGLNGKSDHWSRIRQQRIV